MSDLSLEDQNTAERKTELIAENADLGPNQLKRFADGTVLLIANAIVFVAGLLLSWEPVGAAGTYFFMAAVMLIVVLTMNKIPPTLLNVLRDQFRLMEAWLRPVLLSSERQSNEISELSRQIESCLAGYERLVGRIEATRSEPHP